ncbi:MAG TPA: RnfABCDGE type electron transport complex subunit D [Chloroflexota bacterium]|nr:RnfABCDGE type electron transport complex subunit D [Chloroflexota bacterium]
MSTVVATRTQRPSALTRFVKTPKGYFLVLLGVITAVGLLDAGINKALPGLVAAMVAAALADVVYLRIAKGSLAFPSGALLTGLLIALILSPDEPLYVPAACGIIAVASKYVLRTHWSNVFNPAALALVVAYYLFASGQSWWGSLPDLSPFLICLLIGTGLLIDDYVNKLPAVLVFLATYYGLFTLSAFIGNPAPVAEIFRAPDVNMAVFFAFFMLTDPPTSPARYRDQVKYSVVVAFASYLIFMIVGAVYYLPAGLLFGNAWESARRWARVS